MSSVQRNESFWLDVFSSVGTDVDTDESFDSLEAELESTITDGSCVVTAGLLNPCTVPDASGGSASSGFGDWDQGGYGPDDRPGDLLWQTMAALGEPKQAIALAVSAVLQSPGFLFRVEQGDATRKVGDAVPLTDWEMASRLSFALWDSMPDGELFAAAAAME